MLVLGIDPGIGRCGWGLIEATNNKFKLVDCGCVETKVNGDIEKRLIQIEDEIEKVIKKYKPDAFSIEDLFFGSNASTAFAVGQARGVVLLLAGKNKLEVSVYNPMEVKLALTGYGKAEKRQVAQMVKVLLHLEKLPKLDDTTDALAIALTHAFSSKFTKLTK